MIPLSKFFLVSTWLWAEKTDSFKEGGWKRERKQTNQLLRFEDKFFGNNFVKHFKLFKQNFLPKSAQTTSLGPP